MIRYPVGEVITGCVYRSLWSISDRRFLYGFKGFGVWGDVRGEGIRGAGCLPLGREM